MKRLPRATRVNRYCLADMICRSWIASFDSQNDLQIVTVGAVQFALTIKIITEDEFKNLTGFCQQLAWNSCKELPV